MNSEVPSVVEHAAQVCQVLAGIMLDRCEPPEPFILSAPFSLIPPPTVELQALALEQLLLRFTEALSSVVHSNFHRRFGQPNCLRLTVAFEPMRDRDRRLLLDQSMERWAEAFRTEFLKRHDSPAQRTRRMLDDASGKDGGIAEIARRSGIGRRTLERQFRAEIGLCVLDYRTRIRLGAAVRLLKEDDRCIESVALTVGWSSKKGLYNALGSFSGMTPAEIRGLSDTRISCLLQTLTAPFIPRAAESELCV